MGDSISPPGEVSESAIVLEDLEGSDCSPTDGNAAATSLLNEQGADQLTQQVNGRDSPLMNPSPCHTSDTPATTACSATSDDAVATDATSAATETTTATATETTASVATDTTTVAKETTPIVDADVIAKVDEVERRLRGKPESEWSAEERVWELALRAGSTREEDRVELDEATKQRLRERVREVKGGGAAAAGWF